MRKIKKLKVFRIVKVHDLFDRIAVYAVDSYVYRATLYEKYGGY